MGVGTKMLRNATFLTVGDKVGYLMQFIFFLYFARVFGVVPVGEYSFAFFFTYAFVMLADSGVSVYLVREVARNTSSGRQLFFDCLMLRVVSLILVVFIASAVLAAFFRDFSIQKIVVIGCWGGYWIFNQIADVFLAELNGHEKMGRVALLGIWSKLMSTVAGVFLIYLGVDYHIVLIVFPVSGLLYLCTCILVSYYSLGPINGKFRKFTYYKALFVELVPFFLSVILVEILNCQDILVLGFLQDDQSVGVYSSAIKIVTFILGISAFIQIAIFPVLSRLFVESKEELIEISEKTLKYLILFSLPVAVGLTLTADEIINLLYSESFQEASIVLKITGWAITVGFVQAIYSPLLTAINRQREKVISIGVNFVISSVLNVFLIYHFNYIGASIVKFATLFIGLIFFIYLVARYLAVLPILKLTLSPATACLIMWLFIHFFQHWSLIYLIPVSAFIYLCSLLALGVFTQQEIRFVKNLVPIRARECR